MENLDHHATPTSYERSSNSNKKTSASAADGKSRRRSDKSGADEKSKKENRKSTPMTGISSSSHGSPSRAANEKSGSGGKRRDHPSGVGAVGGRGSILHNTVNPLLTEVSLFTPNISNLVYLTQPVRASEDTFLWQNH